MYGARARNVPLPLCVSRRVIPSLAYPPQNPSTATCVSSDTNTQPLSWPESRVTPRFPRDPNHLSLHATQIIVATCPSIIRGLNHSSACEILAPAESRRSERVDFREGAARSRPSASSSASTQRLRNNVLCYIIVLLRVEFSVFSQNKKLKRCEGDEGNAERTGVKHVENLQFYPRSWKDMREGGAGSSRFHATSGREPLI